MLLCLPAMTMVLPAQAASDPAATVDTFHAALKSRDTKTALSLLEPDAVLYEQGFVEKSRNDYSGAHIAADAEFAAATSYVVVERKILWVGDLAACVITQTRTTGTYQKQVLDLIGTETMLLRRSGDGWLIQHAHWSAHPAADAPPAPVAAHK
jgi:ketosteroid isomerase-like protein